MERLISSFNMILIRIAYNYKIKSIFVFLRFRLNTIFRIAYSASSKPIYFYVFSTQYGKGFFLKAGPDGQGNFRFPG